MQEIESLKEFTVLEGNCLETLKTLPDNSIQMCVTSPPYFNLRDYGTGHWEGGDPNCEHQGKLLGANHNFNYADGRGSNGELRSNVCVKCGAIRVDDQIGLEETPEQFIQKLVDVFHEVKRVLKPDGTLWVNMGDSYCNSNGYERTTETWKREGRSGAPANDRDLSTLHSQGYKTKDLIGIPWKLAEALRNPYYTGKIKNESDRIWMAAMMDAEGSFSLSKYTNNDREKINFYIMMTNSSEKIIEKFNSLFPQEVKHIYEKPGITRKKVYRADIEKLENKEQFLREIYPYVVEKKKQCIVGYTFLQLQKGLPNKKYGYAKEQSEKRNELVEIMHQLNAGNDVELPNYCIEPPTLFEPGFYLRQDIIFAKTNPMPESVEDRCTKSHEYIFLLSKSPNYYFDYKAIEEEAISETTANPKFGGNKYGDSTDTHFNTYSGNEYHPNGRKRKRDVWNVAVSSYKEAHFATYPIKLVEPCILAGSKPGDTVLDPFSGSGTTGITANMNGRKYIGCELNPKYIELSEKRYQEEILHNVCYIDGETGKAQVAIKNEVLW